MTQNRSYKVGSGDNDGKEEKYLITTQFDGLNQLSDECQDQIYLSFDVKKPNSEYWETISFEGETENDYYENMEYVYDEITDEFIEAIRWGVYLDLSDDSFSYIVAKATQEIFVEKIQPMFLSEERNITVPVRLTARDGGDDVIEAISQTFFFNIIGREEEHKCAAATLDTAYTHVQSTHYISFSASAADNEEFAWTSINNTLSCSAMATTNGCNPKYRAKVYDSESNSYMVWKDLENDLVTSYPDHQFESYVYFNVDDATLSVRLSYSDVMTTMNRFTGSDGTVAMSFRVASYIAGSTDASASKDDSELITFEFRIVILIADECADVSLINTQETYDGQ
jgi:hypothetical protein